MKVTLLVITSFVVYLESEGRVDFSQFYLPTCCYLQPEESFAAYASKRIGTVSKREALFDAKNTVQHKLTNGHNEEVSDNPIHLYSLSVPIVSHIDDLEFPPKSEATFNQNTPPSIGKLLVPETSKNTKDGAHSVPLATKLLEKVFTAELGNNFEAKKISRRKLTSTSNRITYLKSHPEFSVWDPQKVANRRNFTQSISAEMLRETPSTMQDYSHETISTPKEMKKIPSSWVKYLRRALYQSLTQGQGLIDTSNEVRDKDNSKSSIKFRIRYPQTWKSIKSAQVEYVNEMSQTSLTPYGTIFLPPEEGPVVSGVLINSPNGYLHVRVASELHQYPDAVEEHNCRCYLVDPGEILVAYWAVSRVFKDNGQPALQYLVYPLPHSVPTPPELLPFTTGETFLPSPVDPMSELYETMNHHPNAGLIQPQQNLGRGQDPAPVRNPDVEGISPNDVDYQGGHLSQVPPTIAGPISLQQPPPPQTADNFDGTYPPDLQQFFPDVQNLLNFQLHQFNGHAYPGIHNPDLYSGPINYQQPSLPPPVHPSRQPQLHVPHPQAPEPPFPPDPTTVPKDLAQQQDPMTPTTFPKSIQDILSPYEGPHPPEIQPTPQTPGSPTPVLRTPSYPVVTVPLGPHGQGMIIHYPYGISPYYTHVNMVHPALAYGQGQPQQGIDVGNRKEKIKAGKVEKLEPDNRDPRPEDEKPLKPEADRDYIVSNLLDNEKKYYPIRRHPSSLLKYYEKHRRKLMTHKLLNDIDDKEGYILDF